MWEIHFCYWSHSFCYTLSWKVRFSCSVMSKYLWPHGLEPTRLLCPWMLQARLLEWAAIPFSGGSSCPRGWTQVPCTAGRFFIVWATREALSWKPQPTNTIMLPDPEPDFVLETQSFHVSNLQPFCPSPSLPGTHPQPGPVICYLTYFPTLSMWLCSREGIGSLGSGEWWRNWKD